MCAFRKVDILFDKTTRFFPKAHGLFFFLCIYSLSTFLTRLEHSNRCTLLLNRRQINEIKQCSDAYQQKFRRSWILDQSKISESSGKITVKVKVEFLERIEKI
jgi:hypothetical protein